MAINNVDTIIVGQGLAGSILAFQLITANKKVMVLDNRHHHSSSQVAAGIINPITGPRLSLADNFSSFYPIAKQFYLGLEKELNIKLWSDVKQQRLIANAQQFSFYKKRSANPIYQNFFSKQTPSDNFKPSSTVVNINHSAIVDCKALINAMRDWLQERRSLLTAQISYDDIGVNERGFSISGIRAEKIIFCEGHQAINNPWFTDLPFLLSKGEILTLETNQECNDLLNWGNWLAPSGGKTKLGSNYQWDNLELSTSSVVRKDLLNSLHTNTTVKATVSDHEVGIRPTTKHRIPFVGPLSQLQNAYCFNGFGSKGCLLIPYYAELLNSSLEKATELPKELTKWL